MIANFLETEKKQNVVLNQAEIGFGIKDRNPF
jgi:hypothetical protein